MASLDDVKFKRMYRLSFADFNLLFDKIHVHLRTKVQMARVSEPIWPVLMLAMTLRSSNQTSPNSYCINHVYVSLIFRPRFLAGGAYLDIEDNFGVSTSSFYNAVWKTVAAIDISFKIGYPKADLNALKNIEKGCRNDI